MNKIMKILVVIVALVVSFFAGAKFQALQYDDLCLDIGGGKNPGNYPICVVEVKE